MWCVGVCTVILFSSFGLVSSPRIPEPVSCPKILNNKFLSLNCSTAVEERYSAIFYKCRFSNATRGGLEEKVVKVTHDRKQCGILPFLNLMQGGCDADLQCLAPNSYCAPVTDDDFVEGPRCKCRGPLFFLSDDGNECLTDTSTPYQAQSTAAPGVELAGAWPAWATGVLLTIYFSDSRSLSNNSFLRGFRGK